MDQLNWSGRQVDKGNKKLSYKLKIDQSFVRDIQNDAENRAIVTAIVNMASSLGMHTIAEGVNPAPRQTSFLSSRKQDYEFSLTFIYEYVFYI